MARTSYDDVKTPSAPAASSPLHQSEERLLAARDIANQKFDLADVLDLNAELLRGVPLVPLLAGGAKLFKNKGQCARDGAAPTYLPTTTRLTAYTRAGRGGFKCSDQIRLLQLSS